MRYFFFLFILTGQISLASVALNSGQVLLDAFDCESTSGAEVKSIATSIGSLKSTIAAIVADKKQCQADLAPIMRLPDIDGILKQIDSYGLSEDLKKAEQIIVEASTDLAIVLRLPADHPDRLLYPSVESLQSSIATARSDLARLRAEGKIAIGNANRQRYLEGVKQIESMSREIAIALSKDSPCFTEGSGLLRQTLTGLMGVAGFFMKSPMGIGITLGGRMLQNLFDIGTSKSNNPNKYFEPAQKTFLVSGLACSMQTMGGQFCRLQRQKELFERLQNEPCVQSKEAKDVKCPDDVKKVMSLIQQGRNANEAITTVFEQLEGKQTSSATQAEQSKINSDFLGATSEFETKINQYKEFVRTMESGELSRKKLEDYAQYFLTDSMMSYAIKIYGSSRPNSAGASVRVPGIEAIVDGMPEEEREKHIFNFIFDDKEYEEAVKKIEQEIQANEGLKTTFEVVRGNGLGTRSVEEAAKLAIFKLATGAKEWDKFPAMKQVRLKMYDPKVVDRAQAKLATLKPTIFQKYKVMTSEEQLSSFIDSFYDEPMGKRSTLNSLKDMRDFLENIPPDFKNLRGRLMKIDDLKDEVNKLVVMGEAIEKGGDKVTTSDINQLFTGVKKLFDPQRGFKDRMASIAQSLQSQQIQSLTKTYKDKPLMNDLIFLQSKEFIEGIYQVKNPNDKKVEIATALQLAEDQLKGYGGFVNDNIGPVLENFKDVNCDGTNSNKKECIIRNNFCIQSLGLVQISSDIERICKNRNAKMELHGAVVSFDAYYKLPHEDRVCAYRNLTNKDAARRSEYSAPVKSTK